LLHIFSFIKLKTIIINAVNYNKFTTVILTLNKMRVKWN